MSFRIFICYYIALPYEYHSKNYNTWITRLSGNYDQRKAEEYEVFPCFHGLQKFPVGDAGMGGSSVGTVNIYHVALQKGELKRH